MKTGLRSLILVLGLVAVGPATSDDVFRIQIGKEYEQYSNKDLKRRVWELERAVSQLQAQVYHLEVKPIAAPVAAVDTWACTIRAVGDSWTGTGPSKALAAAKAVEECKKAQGSGFFCKDPKCEQ